MAITKLNITSSQPTVNSEPLETVKTVDINEDVTLADSPPVIPEYEPTIYTESIEKLDTESYGEYLDRIKPEIEKIKSATTYNVDLVYDSISILNKYNPVNTVNGELSLIDLLTVIKSTYGNVNNIINANDINYKSLIDANTLRIESVYQETINNGETINTISTSFNVELSRIEAKVDYNKASVDGEINTINQLIIDQEGIILSSVQEELNSFGNYISQNYATIQIVNDSISSLVGRTEFNNLGNTVSQNTSAIVQMSDQISLTVTQTEFNSLGQRVTTNESNITLLSNKISLIVSEDDQVIGSVVIGAINDDTTGVAISGDKIIINGETTFQEGYNPRTKSQTFTSTPTVPYFKGDSWINNGIIKTSQVDKTIGVFEDIDWVHELDYGSDAALNDFINNTYTPEIGAINADLDKKIEYWFQVDDPRMDVDWGDNASREGDQWYNNVTKLAYRFTKISETPTYDWELIRDQMTIDALADAATAQDTADGKRRVFTSTPFGPYDIGDLWLTSVNNNEGDLYKCVTAAASGYVESHWLKATDYTNDDAANSKSTIWRDSTIDPSTLGIWGNDADRVGDVWYKDVILSDGTTKEQAHYWDEISPSIYGWILDETTIEGGRIVTGSITADKIVVDSLFAETVYASGAQIGGLDINHTDVVANGITGLRLGTQVSFSPNAATSGVLIGEQSGYYKMFIGNETDNIVFDGSQLLLSGFPMIGSGTSVGVGELSNYFEIINKDQANEYLKCKIDFASMGEITAWAADGYNLPTLWEAMPIASATTLGGIKVGANLSINVNGVLSSTASGGVSSWDDLKDKPVWLDYSTIALFEAGHGHDWNLITNKPSTYSPSSHTHTESEITDLGNYEIAFSKNTAFNKNFGTASGTVAQGNDSRILNGQTAYSWGDHSTVGYGLASALTSHAASSTAHPRDTRNQIAGSYSSSTHTHSYLNNYVSINKSSAASEALDIGNALAAQTVTRYTNANNTTGVIVGIETAGNGILWQRDSNYIRFGSNGTERMRLEADGRLIIGSTTAQSWAALSFTVNDASKAMHIVNINSTSSIGAVFRIDARNGITNTFRVQRDGNVGIGKTASEALDVNGNIKASGEVTAYSDIRLKSNFKIIRNPLDRINQLKGCTYDKDGRRSAGLIAQHVKRVLPEAIHGEESNGKYLSINDAGLSGLFVECIKSLNNTSNNHECRIKQLENENAKLKQLLNIN